MDQLKQNTTRITCIFVVTKKSCKCI